MSDETACADDDKKIGDGVSNDRRPEVSAMHHLQCEERTINEGVRHCRGFVQDREERR